VKKIAVVHPRFLIGGGVDTVIYEVSKRLSRRYEITIFTVDSTFKPIHRIHIHQFQGLEKVGYRERILLTILSILSKQNLFVGYDLLWVHSLPLIPSALQIRNRLNIPLLLTFHGIRTYDPRLVLYRITAKLTFKMIDQIVGVSNYVTEEAKRYGANAIKIYNGCDLKKFHPTYEDWGYILTVGELAPHKVVEVPIRISRELGIPLKVIGDGSERKRLEEYAKRIGADVEFYGLVDEKTLLKAYQRCSFFISGSFHEAFGLSLLEANACAKPVVARNCAAIPEVVRHGRTGFLCNKFKDYLIYSRLLWENESLRSSMGAYARRWAENFTWDRTARLYSKVMENLLSQ